MAPRALTSAPRPLRSPRLRGLAELSDRAGTSAEQQHCELCDEPIGGEHRHLLDLRTHELLCACRACSLLFDRRAAGGGHYRLVPSRRLRIVDFELQDIAWEQLRIPVEMAFFFHDSSAQRTSAFYPSPMGATQSRLELSAWQEIEHANPVLGEMQPDVEALLVNRARGASSHWLLPIDDCYRLVAVIRTGWRGLAGGTQVWREIESFFARLQASAEPRTQKGS